MASMLPPEQARAAAHVEAKTSQSLDEDSDAEFMSDSDSDSESANGDNPEAKMDPVDELSVPVPTETPTTVLRNPSLLLLCVMAKHVPEAVSRQVLPVIQALTGTFAAATQRSALDHPIHR